jgi:hypothetical protein
MTARIHRFEVQDVFQNRGSAIPLSAVTFSPRRSISLRLPCDASRAQRGRNPALLRVCLQYFCSRLRGCLKSCLERSPGAKPAASSTRRLCRYPHPQPLSWKGEGSRKHQSPPRIFPLPSPPRRGAGGEVGPFRWLPLAATRSSCPYPAPWAALFRHPLRPPYGPKVHMF